MGTHNDLVATLVAASRAGTALGATRGQIVALVLTEAWLLVAIGLTIGIACSLAAGHVAASLLFGISARDPLMLGGAAVALATAAGIGSAKIFF